MDIDYCGMTCGAGEAMSNSGLVKDVPVVTDCPTGCPSPRIVLCAAEGRADAAQGNNLDMDRPWVICVYLIVLLFPCSTLINENKVISTIGSIYCV